MAKTVTIIFTTGIFLVALAGMAVATPAVYAKSANFPVLIVGGIAISYLIVFGAYFMVILGIALTPARKFEGK